MLSFRPTGSLLTKQWFYKEYGNKAIETVKDYPYKLCENSGIGFITADKIALSMGMHPLDLRRADEGLIFTLVDAEGRGNLCFEKQSFIKAALKLLDTDGLTEEMAACRAMVLVSQGQLVCYDGEVFRFQTAAVEGALARATVKQLSSPIKCSYGNLDDELDKQEASMKIKFAPEQRSAINTALTNGLAIIIGGPGTGKSMIQIAILDIYKKSTPGKTICLCAPTGKAARRMCQATGRDASIVHKALNLYASEDGTYGSSGNLDAELILVDEVSMLDVYLVLHLF